MSYFDDYIADGLCCEGCGAYLGGSEPGYVRYCAGCRPAEKSTKVSARLGGRGGGKTARKRAQRAAR